MRLEDRSIVVTGASSGLGRSMADAFVGKGASVVYSSYEPGHLEEAIDAVHDRDLPGQARSVAADVRSWDDVRRLVRRTQEYYGGVDVFVNNAGLAQHKVNPDFERRTVDQVPITTWDAIIRTNLHGAFLCSKAVLPGMLERGAGLLIHVSSGHGMKGRANRAPYVASKFGLEGFHETLALELEETGVDSIALRPPSGGVFNERKRLYGRHPEDYTHDRPDVINDAAVRLAAGAGENGGRYVASAGERAFTEYNRSER